VTAARDRVVHAALAWVDAIESEYRARLIAAVPTVVLDEHVEGERRHKQALATAYAAECALLTAVRAVQKEAP
jgi:hypothetical protein